MGKDQLAFGNTLEFSLDLLKLLEAPNTKRDSNKPPYCCLSAFSHSVDATQPMFQK